MKHSFSRIAVLAVVAVMVAAGAFLLAGCTSGNQGSSSASGSASSEPASSSADVVVGGWTVPEEPVSILSADDQAIYDAAEGTDPAMTPVALLATQVVSGLNYAFLGLDDSGWNVLVCYRDAQGKTMLTSTKRLDISNLAVTQESADGNIVGGWTVQVPETAAPLPDEAQKAYDAAMQTAAGATMTPVALLGTQVVSGVNYMILCAGEEVVQDPTPELYVVTIYEDATGKAEVSSVETLDLLKYIGN